MILRNCPKWSGSSLCLMRQKYPVLFQAKQRKWLLSKDSNCNRPGYWQWLKAPSTLILLALGRAKIKVQDWINSTIATNFEENIEVLMISWKMHEIKP